MDIFCNVCYIMNMIKISAVVYDIIQGDETALEALRAGILNFSAYARKIKPQIENRLYKNVQQGSIVTALSRIVSRSTKIPSLRPDVRILDMSIKSPLCEVSYEKTEETLKKASKLIEQKDTKGKFFTITQGITEITIILCSDPNAWFSREAGIFYFLYGQPRILKNTEGKVRRIIVHDWPIS